MRVLFLNQYFPPDPAPTGVLLAEVAATLTKAGHAVDFVAARQEYRAGQKQGGRMIREALALWRMLVDGLRKPRSEVIVSASSPPCLLVVATLVAGWHRARSVHWVMDVYPEIAVALGEVRAGVLSRTLGALMGWCYRRATRVVVLDEDMAARIRVHGVEPAIVRPWVFAGVLRQLAATHEDPQAEWTWIYSGNLGRAHEWETLLQAQAELERRGAPIRLLFQGGGPSRPVAAARARELGLRQVEWRDYVPEDELPAALLRCHALVGTQLPAAQGLLWPSKLGLAMSLPRPLAWVGPPDGAIAKMLGAFPHAAVFAPGQSVELAGWLAARMGLGAAAPGAVFDAAAHRDSSLAAFIDLVATA
ncbi:MAG: glycosyltransferase family 4 protein [Chthoniobacteraceae bacterium]